MSFAKKAAAGALLGGSLIFTAGLGVAVAQPSEAPEPTEPTAAAEAPAGPDGLVNLLVGGKTLLDAVPAEEAATTAAANCGGDPAAVVALAQQVDTDGSAQTVCEGVVFVQNGGEAVSSAPAEGDAPSMEPPPVPGDNSADVPFNGDGAAPEE